MGSDAKQTLLNLGCGYKQIRGGGWVNVDAYECCQPDVVWDLNTFPYPWEDNSVDGIMMSHILEHIPDWWGAFNECARILKPGGRYEVRVPDESSATALTYRDHFHVFSLLSFHGISEANHGTSAWARENKETVPLKLESYQQVPFKQYNWMVRFPRLLRFCANHLRNYIHEQVFIFRKIS
jgi:ubiquinone/menaquinone biosynthesis C-methylase UbiE